MSGLALSRLVTGACIALSLQAAIPARADVLHSVTGNQGLAVAAEQIRTTNTSGTHIVRFSSYANVGRFRLDSPPTRVETLVFERDSLQLSDSALWVTGDTALLEIKNMRAGTVILRGLAFHLASPEARLLAGAEPGKENHRLVIDSCFIFGDNNASSFLTWLGAAGSQVEIRRSFFVFGTGNSLQSKAILTAANVILANNLIHYGGQLSATVLAGGLFDLRSNTVHRTQFKLASEVYQSARYEINRNFIGHRPGQDAFGDVEPYFFWATNFHPLDSYVRNNIILKGWKGFDHPGTSPRLFAADSLTNQTRDSFTVKPVTELWNWYGPNGPMDSTGHAFGRDRRSEPYNVFPGADSAILIFEGNTGTVRFKPALFPRQIAFDRIPVALPAGHDSVRFHSPGSGALRFGPFQVDSIVLNMASPPGRAQLFSGRGNDPFVPQRIVSAQGASVHVFPNDFPAARFFLVAFRGNTPRGVQVTPERLSSRLAAGDSLAFGKVDSAGFTYVNEVSLSPTDYPDSLRSLGRNLAVQTSASVSGTMVYGSVQGSKPYLSDQVFWWRPKDSLLDSAVRAADGRLIASAPSRSFNAYLVEKLNVKRGKPSVFPLPGGGEVRAGGPNGFQLRIDSLYVPDPLHFGRASPGFSLRFPGRQTGDSVILLLPGGPDTEVFQVAGDSFTTVPSAPESSGLHRLSIGPGDSTLRFFSGIRFNVIAGREFNDTLAGVGISGLASSTSGRISTVPFDAALLSRGIGTEDILPSNTRLLGARGFRTMSLTLGQRLWSANFPVSRPNDSARVVAYAWDGLKWRLLPPPVLSTGESIRSTINGLGSTDQAVAVFELMKPATEYVRPIVTVGDRAVSVTVTRVNDVDGPIKEFSLRVLHLKESGSVEFLDQGPVPVGQTLEQSLAAQSGLFMYGVIYHSTQGEYRPAYVPITKFSWKPLEMSVGGKPEKAAGQWHLLGAPCSTSLAKSLPLGQLADTSAADKTDFLRLKSINGAAAWESVLPGDSLLKPGDAFLFNSARVAENRVDPVSRFVASEDHALGPHTGWRLVSPPYPIAFLASAVGSNQIEVGDFLELKVVPLNPPVKGKRREYSWGVADRLQPFAGYAYKFADNEVLTFNPWTALTPLAAPKRGAAPSPLGAVRVTLRVEDRTRSMQLVAGAGIREMPYLQAPGEGLEMEVGGEGGWFRKKVVDLLAIDEPIVIRNPAPARGRLDLALEGLPARSRNWQARLIHTASGRILDPAAGFALPQGDEEYRLVAGSEAFLAERISAYQSGIPAGLVLSQNFPNPFRAQTRIHLDWPALVGDAAGSARKARLEVFDARGRRVHSLDLAVIRAGRQVITLDGSRWEPGLYTYRLTVLTAGSRATLQKRMLVSP